MTGVEPRTSGIGSDRSINWATTIILKFYVTKRWRQEQERQENRKKCKKVCVEKVWVKPQSKFPKIFIVALSFLSIFPFLFYFIFSHFIAKEETQCLCKSGHGQ